LPRRKRPRWWTWELELSPHLHKRMLDRGFNEVDLRIMIEATRRIRRDVVGGRWVIETRFRRTRWEVIVEPDHELRLLVVVTAYPLAEE
jgi:hypothetical protein